MMSVVNIWFIRLGLTSAEQDNDEVFFRTDRNKYAKK
jgi:hypothetical protein